MEDKDNRWKKDSKRLPPRDFRIKILSFFLIFFAGVIGVRLFFIQVINHVFYEAMASGQHDRFQELFPSRGKIFIHDYKDDQEIAVATNQQLAAVYADPYQIKDPLKTTESLTNIFSWD